LAFRFQFDERNQIQAVPDADVGDGHVALALERGSVGVA
jgi:hypothetical protein